MSSMKCVYVAGAYSGVCTTDIQDNMRRGMQLAHKVLMAGFSPFTPWHDFLHSLFGHVPLNAYYAFSMAQLETAHAVIVVPERAEQSLGTQREIKRAKELGIPIFWNMDELCDWGDRVSGRVPFDSQTGEPLPPIADDDYNVGNGAPLPMGYFVDDDMEDDGPVADEDDDDDGFYSAGYSAFDPHKHPLVQAAEEKMAKEDREAASGDTGEPLPPIVDDGVSFRGQSEDEWRVSGKGVSQPPGCFVDDSDVGDDDPVVDEDDVFDEEGILTNHGCDVFAPYMDGTEEDEGAAGIDGQSESNILLEAHEVTTGPRQRDYDHPKPNHERIARLWNAYLKSRSPGSAGEIGSEDVCWMMIMVKMSRDMFCPKRDNLVDVAGYARCIEQIREGAKLNKGTLRREGCKPPKEST